MPKPLHPIPDHTLDYIRHKIGVKTGIQIRVKSDCQKVSGLIHDATGHSLSESTLYRLFLQNTTDSKPYLHTLNVIARFCGFDAWHELEQHLKSTITAVIIDDEKPARENLNAILQHYFPDVRVLRMASSVSKGVDIIRECKPQLVFLDVEMGKSSGFDLIKKTEGLSYETIFVTAYREYAVDAFRINAADYLLKPIELDQLGEALQRVRNRLSFR